MVMVCTYFSILDKYLLMFHFLSKGRRAIPSSVQRAIPRTNVAVLAGIAAANANKATVPIRGRGWTSTSTTTCKSRHVSKKFT